MRIDSRELVVLDAQELEEALQDYVQKNSSRLTDSPFQIKFVNNKPVASALLKRLIS